MRQDLGSGLALPQSVVRLVVEIDTKCGEAEGERRPARPNLRCSSVRYAGPEDGAGVLRLGDPLDNRQQRQRQRYSNRIRQNSQKGSEIEQLGRHRLDPVIDQLARGELQHEGDEPQEPPPADRARPCHGVGMARVLACPGNLRHGLIRLPKPENRDEVPAHGPSRPYRHTDSTDRMQVLACPVLPHKNENSGHYKNGNDRYLEPMQRIIANPNIHM